MIKKDLLEEVKKLAEPICILENVVLFDVEYVKEGPFKYLRIYIDQDGGITIDDCQRVSEKISKILDSEDLIEENYFLEVSSPGIDRPFKTDADYESHLNESVEIKLYQGIQGMKHFEGILLSVDEEKIEIKFGKDTNIQIERKNIARINKAIQF